ncbi:MAG: cofactor-independent phosphoglycerate mutase [bacterium]
MNKRKTVIFLGDGMADEPVEAIGGKTPLQYARTPAMDSIARDGRSGTLSTLLEGFPTSSEVANMSVLGCDVPTEYCGRGPIEAAGRGIPLGPGDIAFRVNLTTVDDGGVLRDFSGGHVGDDDAAELIKALNSELGAGGVRFHQGVSYRHILVLSDPRFSPRVKTEKPDDHHGDRVVDCLPRAIEPAAEETAALLRKLISDAADILVRHPVNKRLASEGRQLVNGIWPCGGGRAGALKTLREKYGISSAVISAVDVIKGLGRCLGMDVLEVPGATGYIDTNYEGKADAAVKALETHDLVYLHVEGIDEVSHEQNLQKKIAAIEDFDSRIIARVLSAAGTGVDAAVLADHPVPVRLGKHTRNPVPVAVRMAGSKPDGIMQYDEISCLKGGLGAMNGPGLMNLLFR